MSSPRADRFFNIWNFCGTEHSTETDFKPCAAGLAFGDADPPAVGLDDVGDNRKTEAGPLVAGRVAVLEDLLASPPGNAGAVVGEIDAATVVKRADRDRDRVVVVVDAVPVTVLEDV